MMKLKTLVIYIMLTTPVLAVNYGEPGHNPGADNNGVGGPPNNNGNNNGNTGTNITIGNSLSSNNRAITKNRNTNLSKSNSNAKSSSYSGGNKQKVVVQSGGDVQYSGQYKVETTGIAPDIVSYSTAPCRVAVGASGGWLGGAFGFTGSILDEGCDIWRDAENLSNGGYKEAADLRLCDKPELKKLLPHCNSLGYTEEVQQITTTFKH